MQTFASGTDIDEIKTNASLHDYYVSLIVNFSGQYTCKIGVYSEDSHVINRFRISPLTNTKEHIGSFNKVEKNVEILDCEIKYEDNEVISEVVKVLKNSQNKSRTFSSGKYSADDYVLENPKWDKLSNVKQTSLFWTDQRFKPNKEKALLDNATMLDMVIETLMLDEDMQGELLQISIEVENATILVDIKDSYFISILSKIEAIVNAFLTLKSIQEIIRDINQYTIDYEVEEIEYLIKHLSNYKNIKLIFERLLKEKINDGL